jgi:hemerythrin-like metal-binding protein
MDLFQWSEDHIVHLPEIDAEHKNIFRLGRELCDAIAAGAPKPRVKQMFGNLAEAASAHFSHEERLMKKAGYSSLAWHKQSHDAVRKRVAECLPRTQDGDLDTCKEFLKYLYDWLNDHAGIADRMMASYLRNRARSRVA